MDTVSDGQLVRLRHAAQPGAPIRQTAAGPRRQPGRRPGRAELMALSLAQDFCHAGALAETRSVNTAENARFSAEILPRRRRAPHTLVTHSWHMPRALQFAATGLQVILLPPAKAGPPCACRMACCPARKALWHSSQALREGVGLLAYALRGVF